MTPADRRRRLRSATESILLVDALVTEADLIRERMLRAATPRETSREYVVRAEPLAAPCFPITEVSRTVVMSDVAQHLWFGRMSFPQCGLEWRPGFEVLGLGGALVFESEETIGGAQ